MSRAPNKKFEPEKGRTRNIATANRAQTRQPELTTAQSSAGSRPRSAKQDGRALEYYPAYCHKLSNTWFTWVKLTAYDVHHRLESTAGYHHSLQSVASKFRDTPQVLFFLNHPIQFVQVAGVVVNFEEHFQKFWLLTIDDSSGRTIDIICKKPEEEQTDPEKATNLLGRALLSGEDDAEVVLRTEARKLAEVISSSVEIGSILQVKGTVTLFHRNAVRRVISEGSGSEPGRQESQHEQIPLRQISAQRVAILSTAAAELAFIAARDSFFETVLSQPWILSSRKQTRLQQEAYGDVRRERSRAVKRLKVQKEKREEEQRENEELSRVWEEEEAMRDQHAAVAKQAAGSLYKTYTPVSNNTPRAPSAVVDPERLALLKNAFG